MNKILLLSLSLCFVTCKKIFAQSDSTSHKLKELGVGMRGLDEFEMLYQWGNDTRVFRLLGGYSLNRNTSKSESSSFYPSSSFGDNIYETSNSDKSLSESLSIGISRISFRSINKNIQLIFGPRISLAYSFIDSEGERETSENPGTTESEVSLGNFKSSYRSLSPAVGGVIGGRYIFNDKLSLYLDFSPEVYFNFGKSKSERINYNGDSNSNSQSTSISYGVRILNSTARLSLFLKLTD